MDNSAYITLSKQMALFRDMDVTANNMANMNTTGYTASHVRFSSYLVEDGKRGDMAFAHDINTYDSQVEGAMRTTGNTFDVAIDGDGFFAVETPLGTRYTRAGNFRLNEEGILITPEGYQVQSEGGAPIQFTPEDQNISIGEVGNISVNGEERAFIGVVQFADPQLLQKRGTRMFSAPEGVTPLPSINARVAQGMLEDSNVQPITEMTHMIEVSRAVGSTAKFIETVYDLQRQNNQRWTQQV